MTSPTPPWSLHWNRDGELTQPDREDLLRRIVGQEQGLHATLLTAMLDLTDAPEPPSSGTCTLKGNQGRRRSDSQPHHHAGERLRSKDPEQKSGRRGW